MPRPQQKPDADGTIGTIRPFADVLRDLGKGQVADEAALMLTSLVQAVRTHGKKGRFTLTIEIAPMKGSERNLLVAAQAKASPPTGDPIAAVFFDDYSGNLHRNDPQAQTFDDLAEVAKPDAHLKDAR